MIYKYSGSKRIYKGRKVVPESALTTLDSKTLDLAIKQKTIKKDGSKKREDKE